ncbi:hypothetical protein JM654_09005 [Microbacterium oxydans]|nr:hypothetical protein [Microbacterium oxydans]
MTTLDLRTRIPLRFPTAAATFAIGIAGYLGVNLSPYMITAAQTGLGLDVLAASWLVTATLLLTAVTGLAIAPLCAGTHRRTVARSGLGLAVVGFATAALAPAAMLPGLLLGGAGAGGAVAASGAALAAFRNPDRVAGFNGLANRGVITVVLAVIPLIGLAPIDVFGALALFSLIGLVATAWLPAAPVVAPHAGAAVAEAMPIEVPPTGTVRTSPTRTRTVTAAGVGLLLVFALWAASEDSLWAMAGVMGAEQAGLTPEGLGIALSGATAGGLLGSLLLMIVGGTSRARGTARDPARRRRRAQDRGGLRDRSHHVHRDLHRLELGVRDRLHVLRVDIGGPGCRRPLVGPPCSRCTSSGRPSPPSSAQPSSAFSAIRDSRSPSASRASSSPYPPGRSPSYRRVWNA